MKDRIDMQSQIDEEDLHTLKTKCKGKRTVGKVNKGINVKKYSWFKKIKIIKKRKEKQKKTEKKKRKTPWNCKSPRQRHKFITTIKV